MGKIMEAFPYKRVAVIGCPGGGKSTFSRALRDATGLPLYHLDAIYWREDRTHLSREEFYPLMQEIIAKDEWIMDGNYQSTLEWRIAACDLLIFLDYPAEVCLAGVRERRGQARSDMRWVEKEEDEEFMAFIRAFAAESRPRILELIEKYPDKAVVIFTDREESMRYLEKMKI
jgi:adenylate kinase family enzyme